MNEELEKYTIELNEVQKAIGQVEGMIHTKEENVKELQSLLENLVEVREKIEDKIADREKEAKETDDELEMNSKEKEPKEPEEEFEIEEVYDERNGSGLRVDRLDGGLMKVVSGANKTRNGNIFQQMKARAAERAKLMPEEEKIVEEKDSKATPIIEDEEIAK